MIKNKYDFMFVLDCTMGNPNGDPDADNEPRMDPETMQGYMTDASIKRKVRDYVTMVHNNESPNAIFVQKSTNLNKKIALAYEETGGIPEKANLKDVERAQKFLFKNFYDIRTFGAVMSTGANAGQSTGAVQITFPRSVDPIFPIDVTLTRMAVADKVKGTKGTSKEIEEWEQNQQENKLRTFGHKHIIPYGLYVGTGFISAFDAKRSGFSEEDLNLFWEALLNMFEHSRTASKGLMSMRALYIFKHVGTDSDLNQRENQAILGCANAYELLDDGRIITIKKNIEGPPRKFSDYSIIVNEENIPAGIELIVKKR